MAREQSDDDFWADWAASADRLTACVSDFLCRQEGLVRNALDGKSLVVGIDRRPEGNFTHAGVVGDVAGNCGECSDLALEVQSTDSHRSPAVSEKAWSSGDLSKNGGQGQDLVTVVLGGWSEQPGGQALQADSERQHSSKRTTAIYHKLKASHQRSGTAEGRWEDFDAWQSEYAKMKEGEIREQRVKRLMDMSVVAALPTCLLQLLEWWVQLEEPLRSGCLSKLIKHKFFNVLVGLVIALNTIFTVQTSNYGMEHPGEQLPVESSIGQAFLVFFSLEMVLKLRVHKLYFFCNEECLWNCFDFFLVAISAVDIVITLMTENGGKHNIAFARGLRVFKVGRILRMFSAVKFLKAIRALLNSIAGSFITFGWSVVVLIMVCFAFALLFVQQIAAFIADAKDAGSINDELWVRQQKYFGTVERGTLSLLMVAMGGADWDIIIELIEPLGTLYFAALVFFLVFFSFALVNIVAGMFLETVMRLTNPGNEERITEAWMQEAQDLDELFLIVGAMDVERAGIISKEVFANYCKYAQVQLHFAKMGLDVKHPDQFFLAATSGAGVASIVKFVEGAVLMKGSASTVDMHRLEHDLRNLRQVLIQKIGVTASL